MPLCYAAPLFVSGEGMLGRHVLVCVTCCMCCLPPRCIQLKLTFSCMMDLSKFPLDSQVCTMEVASFSKTIEELSLEWKTMNPVIMGKGLRMPQFEIVKIAASDCQESFQIVDNNGLTLLYDHRLQLAQRYTRPAHQHTHTSTRRINTDWSYTYSTPRQQSKKPKIFDLKEETLRQCLVSFQSSPEACGTSPFLFMFFGFPLIITLSSPTLWTVFQPYKRVIVRVKCHSWTGFSNYSCLVAEFHLTRSVGFHLVQSYLPTILIVIISWVSFWMDVDSVPGRTTLGVTTLLAVSSQSSGIQSGLPQVSYVKAIDVWMGTCTAFVFCALLEFTFVNYMWRKQPGGTKTPDTVNGQTASKVTEDDQDSSISVSMKKCGLDKTAPVVVGEPSPAASLLMKNKVRARRIDEMCRLFFPLVFGLFNLIYWSYYLS
uniref:Uncharacterized protein n=1 Tax=Timema bartmani TaxID=61472 RepID=A0A7R9I0C8_9NEOP|nr:unnamed protein product [Timema bartmani]